MGVPYPMGWEDRIRNYVLGFHELGLPRDEMQRHFIELLGEASALRTIRLAEAEIAEKLL